MKALKTRQATIFDVARLAGVSHQTVSRVLNNLPNVRPTTREKVEVAIRQLSYTPSPAARALVTRRSATIAVLNTGAADFGPASIAIGLCEAAGPANYTVTMSNSGGSDPESIRSVIVQFVRQNVEAIVVIAARTASLEALSGIDLDIPLLTIESAGRPGFHSVSLDQYRGARLAVRHLIDLGHTRIEHVAGPSDSLDALERLRGWRDELGEAGIAAPRPLQGSWTPDSGSDAATELLARSDRGTAVFVANDQMALGFMHTLERAGICVPDDISVIGYDDIPEAAYFTPPLTTMKQDFDALGRQIMGHLLEVLRDPSAPSPTRFVPSLVVRESVRALR